MQINIRFPNSTNCTNGADVKALITRKLPELPELFWNRENGKLLNGIAPIRFVWTRDEIGVTGIGETGFSTIMESASAILRAFPNATLSHVPCGFKTGPQLSKTIVNRMVLKTKNDDDAKRHFCDHQSIANWTIHATQTIRNGILKQADLLGIELDPDMLIVGDIAFGQVNSAPHHDHRYLIANIICRTNIRPYGDWRVGTLASLGYGHLITAQ